MKFDRRITNGLAWAGVVVVIGVPTADLLSAQFMGEASVPAPQIAVIEPVAPTPAPLSDRPAEPTEVAVAAPAEVAPAQVPAKPVATANAQPGSAMDSFLQSGRKLPSYITGAESAPQAAVPAKPVAPTAPVAPATPVAVAPAAPAVTDPVEVASIPPAKVAPIPMPLSMRPATPVAVVRPSQPAAVVTAPRQIPVGVAPATVTANDLDDWESGPLSEFLANRQGQGQRQAQPVDPSYDANGFFLDQGPNPRRQPQRDEYIGPVVQDDFFFPFTQ